MTPIGTVWFWGLCIINASVKINKIEAKTNFGILSSFVGPSDIGLPMWKINLRISNNLHHAHEELTDA